MCKTENCTTKPSFNYVGEEPAFCKKHKTKEMVNVKLRKDVALENIVLDRVPNKVEETTINVSKRFTLVTRDDSEDDCSDNETFSLNCLSENTPFKGKGICREEKCTLQGCFNFPGEKERLYCSKHKLQGMIDIAHKRCIFKGCDTRASFNIKGEKTGLYCYQHKIQEMVNVVSKRCSFEDCDTAACFNIKGQKTALYCSKHKITAMVDIKNKKCAFESCTAHPNYNVKSEKTALYCSKHKIFGMINVTSKTCCFESCNVIPNYNFKDEKTALYCSEHKAEGMVDVKSKRCLFEGCDKHSTYNIKGQKTTLYCSEHKLDGMVNVRDKTCLFEGCDILPVYNMKGQKTALYCSGHKSDAMVDVKSKRCKGYECFTLVKDKYEGYCLYCFMNLFPDKPVARNYKTKEFAVADHIKTVFSQYDWAHDRTVRDGCSRKRPDFLLDMGYQVVIVEVDENHHQNYDCSCENKRIMELSQDLGHRPIVFIRFNPDSYKDKGKRIPSCWKVGKDGILRVDNKKQWSARLDSLCSQIEYWSQNKTDKTVEIIQLYFDA